MDIVSFQKKFVHGLRWNSLESILYYTLLAIHQIALRTVTDEVAYGAIGTLFALIYLIILVLNGGLDLSIGPFFSEYKNSKQLFKNYLFKQLIIQVIVYTLAAIIIIMILSHGYLPIKRMPVLPWPLTCILALLIITEGIKKSLRIILQLSFLTHITATVELFYIIGYVTIVWTSYFLYKSVSLYTVFVPMFLLSCISTLFLFIATFRFYCTLENTDQCITYSWKRIIYNRLSNYIYQVTRALFTSNFLIPFFAFTYGLSIAALLELVTACNQFISIIISKIFGITGQSLFAHVKQMSISYKRTVFEHASRRLYPILYGILTLVLVAYKPLLAFNSPAGSSEYSFIGLLFFLLLFSENFIILYEKWFIIEEKTSYLIGLNSFLLLLFWAAAQLFYNTYPHLLLVFLIALRVITYLCLSVIASYKWKLNFSYKKGSFHL